MHVPRWWESRRRPLRWKTSFLCVLVVVAALAQTPQIESEDVNRVASHIACQCGGCKESVSCPMSKRGCHFCVPQKARIYKMQKAGMSDDAIIETYKKEFGDKIYLSDPSIFYWLVPVMAIALGMLAIYWFIRRMTSRVPATAIPVDPSMVRFQDEIEKEMQKLD
jgi:cytochrome c-type biogenesis protein CcmH/NrfF